MPPRLRLTLDHARDLSPSVRHLLFSVEGEPASWRAGQCVTVEVPVGPDLFPRNYSIACASKVHGGRRIELAVARVPDGPASNALHALPPGARLEAGRPCGYLIRSDPDAPTLWVGTGSGLAPLRAMIQEELGRERGTRGPRLGLLFGCRTERDILWADELQTWARHHPRFQLFLTLSGPEGAWQGRRGYVQAHLADALAQVQPTQVFICGLSTMTTSVEGALVAAGFPKAGIHLEEYDP
jgi:ferredoxin-NADP reductase